MAAAPNRPALPALLLANDLLDGDVVFAANVPEGGLSWTRDPGLAAIAHDESGAESLETFAAAEFAANRVVDAYLVDIEPGAHAPVPRHYRERMKTLGPSNRTDLGKQAGDGIASAAPRT